MSERPYPDGLAWDEAWRQRQRADELTDQRDQMVHTIARLTAERDAARADVTMWEDKAYDFEKERDRLAAELEVVKFSNERYKEDCEQAEAGRDRLREAAIALLRATHIGDQNFVGLLRDAHAEPIRRAVMMFERILKAETGGDDE